MRNRHNKISTAKLSFRSQLIIVCPVNFHLILLLIYYHYHSSVAARAVVVARQQARQIYRYDHSEAKIGPIQRIAVSRFKEVPHFHAVPKATKAAHEILEDGQK